MSILVDKPEDCAGELGVGVAGGGPFATTESNGSVRSLCDDMLGDGRRCARRAGVRA